METQPTLWEQMTDTFLSAFLFPGLDWTLILVAIALGVAFGAIWLVAYRPPVRTGSLALLTVAAISAVGTWTAIAFVQLPLDVWLGEALVLVWGSATVSTWLLLAAVPAMLITGLVQEAAKLVPVLAYRSRRSAGFDARTGLIVGAIAGAGFGVFEAVWVHNSMFAADPAWQTLRDNGLVALVPFAERFFAIGFHIAASAIAGYGLATGRPWRFWLLAACLHGGLNYGVALVQAGVLDGTTLELYVAAFAVAVSAAALRLRWGPASGGSPTIATPRVAGVRQPT